MPTPPDLRLAPYNRLKTLRQEIVPWAPFSDWGDPNALVPNQDEVLTYLAQQDERAYTRMERSEPIVHQGILRRTRTLLAAGWELKPASNKPAARLLSDYCEQLLKRLRARWSTNLAEMHRAVFVGWRPLERVWDFSDTFKGKPAWYLKAVRAKEPHEYRFTPARDLVWIGNQGAGASYVRFPFDDEASRMRWLICTAGSSDTPYGIGELRYVWMIYYIKREFMKLWSQGIQRSMGSIILGQTGTSALGSLATREAQSAAGAPGQAKTVEEIGAEFQRVLKLWQESGVFIKRSGWDAQLFGDISYADGWKEPLDYCDRLMALCLTGDVLSLGLGTNGSRAAAETKSEHLDELCIADGDELSGWINEQILGDALRVQFREDQLDPDDFPEFQFKLGHEIDLDAAKWLFLSGARIDGRKVAAEFGVPLIIDEQPGDVVLEKQQMVLDPTSGKLIPANAMPGAPGQPPVAPTKKPTGPGGPDQQPGQPDAPPKKEAKADATPDK